MRPNGMENKEKIRAFLVETFLFGSESLNEDTPLIEEHIIDSTGMLEIIAFIERTYGVRIDDDEMIPENFNSIRSMAEYLERKTAGR